MEAFNFQDFFSAFIVLFAIIDVTGSIPIFVDLKERKKKYSPLQASFYSFLILLAFFFVGEGVLRLFNVDISSFAVAGSIVLFVIGCEMTFGVEIFKMDSPTNSATMIPIIFPLLAGPGAFTALLSLKAEYSSLEIISALLLNMCIVFLVLKKVSWVEKLIGAAGIYVLRKFFGIIVLAIAVKLFMGNITFLLGR
ncbi:MAG: MarC family protein [Dysgonamonadaceae bacterium]|jgi:multiple antibiotic resistance protein|nr:MarC family protein [Dysgonamonadaceae bacterium]